MCRVLGYLGGPVSLEGILYEADSALVRQSYSPRMMNAFLNLAGFGMAAWDETSIRGDEPFTYQVTTMPNYDRNLRSICRTLAPTCVLAHVLPESYERIRWFPLPGEAQARIVGGHGGA